jgi:hypothetical protein
MGIFAGSLQFTAYRSGNLLRMEAIAKTDEPSVAYNAAGLHGFSAADATRHARSRRDPLYEFGGIRTTRVSVKAKNRVLVAGGGQRLDRAFPSPHTFFTREVDTNLGYVWYRKDSDAVRLRRASGGRRRGAA